MKKKTLLVLLIVALAILYFTLFVRIIDLIRVIVHYIDLWERYKDDIVFDYMLGVVKPTIEILLQLSVAILFTYITVALIKREQLSLRTEEEQEILREKKDKKREQKILQLNAKIEKLKNEDDD